MAVTRYEKRKESLHTFEEQTNLKYKCIDALEMLFRWCVKNILYSVLDIRKSLNIYILFRCYWWQVRENEIK